MLNAFRHHGGLHEKVPTWTPLTVGCAQRLSASRLIARAGSWLGSWLERRVLNAFRHHGGLHRNTSAVSLGSAACSTPFGITADCTSSACVARRNPMYVLNAFRHHGGLHEVMADVLLPFYSNVLNAFRHHGGLHNRYELPCARAHGKCSTPFGITADCTCRIHHGTYVAQTCSTPFGITADCTCSPDPRGL